ncbi:MAG: choice-of-anchor D domain-containing protein [Verrucomicrobiota bacterium]
MRALAPLFVLFGTFAACLCAAPGDLDPGYNPAVYPDSGGRGLMGISVNEEGHATVGGALMSEFGSGFEVVREALPEGGFPPAFEAPSLNLAAQLIARQWDGKILVAGDTMFVQPSTYRGIQRLNSDGSLDTHFTAVVSEGIVNAMAIQADGKIVIGGNFKNVNGVAKANLARLNADGSLDEGFAASVGSSQVLALAIMPDQKIVVGGNFSAVNGTTRRSLAMLHPDGSLVAGFSPTLGRNTGTVGIVNCVVVHPDGNLTVGGSFEEVNGNIITHLVRLQPNGSVHTALSQSATVRTAVLQSDGKLLIGGDFEITVSGQNYPKIARLMPDGQVDGTFKSPYFTIPANQTLMLNALTLQRDGRVLVGVGYGTSDRSGPAPRLLRRLENGGATESLSVIAGTRIEWLRDGTSPEALEVRFEVSMDGASWDLLGYGSRISNGWMLDGLTLPPSGFLRARARTCGGCGNGSFGLVGKTIPLDNRVAELVISGPDSIPYSDNSGSFNLGTNYGVKTFTLRNQGNAPLRLNSIVFENAVSCLISANTQATTRVLQPGEQTTFTVFMDPQQDRYYRDPLVTMKVISNASNNPELKYSLSGQRALSPRPDVNFLGFTYQFGNQPEAPLPFSRHFVPERTVYFLSIPHHLQTARLWVGLPPEDWEDPRVVRLNGQQYGTMFGLPVSFARTPQPLVLEVRSPDRQNWKTYTINVTRNLPKPGDRDFTFVPSPSGGLFADVILPDGKIMARGMRLNANGTRDTSFPPIGHPTQAAGVHVQPDLSFLIVEGNSLDHILSNGWPDWSSFALGSVNAFVKMQDGGILLASSSAGSPGGILKRLLPPGALDPPFADLDVAYVSPVTERITSLIELPDGKILISGQFQPRMSHSTKGVARLNAEGTLDESFHDASFNHRVESMIRQPDGKILVYGRFSQVAGQQRLGWARLNADGSHDATFQPVLQPSWETYSAALQTDGKILLAGKFGGTSGSLLTLLRLNADGSRDTTLEAYSSYGDAKSIVLQADGSILLSGFFGDLNQMQGNGFERLYNNPALDSLTVPDATRVLWERSGAGPEALAVYFECSTDGGQTWTGLGQGTYITGGWELAGLNLPAQGKVRARAVLQSGYYSRSRGMVESVTEFSFTPAALVVENQAGQPLVSGSTSTFGPVGLGGLARQTFAIKNTGETRLQDIRVEIEGAAAAEFRLQEPVGEFLPKAGSQALVLLFTPAKLGSRTAVAKIYSSALGSTPFQILLNGEGRTAHVPVVKTLAASAVDTVSAKLGGTVNAKGVVREVFFEYGPTKNFGRLLALSPATVEGTAVENVEATLTGLLPKTRYYFRILAASAEGGAAGATLSFVTGNRAPLARDDTRILVHGPGPVTLNVLANDEDPDGDAISLASFTPLLPEGSGTLTKAGNALVFTMPENIATCSFTYQAKDSSGALSAPATVRLTVTPDLSLSAANSGPVPAVGTEYYLHLSAYASWKIVNPMPWVRVDVMEGFGDRSLRITVLPNNSTKPRSGSLTFGYNASHEITQEAVLLPVLTQADLPVPLPPAYVAAPFELSIPTQNLPVTYTVKNLPPGLSLDGTTGILSGMPTKAGRYATSIRARNAAGTAVVTLRLDLVVEALPQGFQGRYEGVIGFSDTRARSIGGRYELTVTATGAFTGKVTQGTKTESMKGFLVVSPHLPTDAVATATLPGSKTGPLRQFRAELYSSGDGRHNALFLTDNVATDAGYGWRIPWNGKDRLATAFAETYSFVTSPVDLPGPAPEGHGYGTFTIAGKTGAVKITGRLADGTPYISSAFVSEQGEISLYQSLYSQGGALVGALAVGTSEEREENDVFGNMDWVKHPVLPGSKEIAYRDGFSMWSIAARGGVLPRLAPGGRILDLPESETAQAELKFSGGGLPAPFDAGVTVTNPSSKGLTNKAVVAATAEAVALPQLDTKKGTFSGTFTLTGSTPALNRKTAFSGQVVQIEGVVKGYGFFMMPELPAEGGSLKTSPRQSGAVLFQAAPSP